jgi:hypothetical protein
MDIYNGGPEISIRSLKKDSMKFVLSNTDLRYMEFAFVLLSMKACPLGV